jgi:hypothetical protein
MSLLGRVEIPRPFDPSAKLRTGRARDMLQAKRSSVMLAYAGIRVTDSVRHTVGKRYLGDDKTGMTGTRVDFESTGSECLGLQPMDV